MREEVGSVELSLESVKSLLEVESGVEWTGAEGEAKTKNGLVVWWRGGSGG